MTQSPKENHRLFPEECLIREITGKPRLSIGIPKENPDIETRLALTPEGVAIITEEGHSVYVQRGAGEPMSYTDLQYSEAGAFMVDDMSGGQLSVYLLKTDAVLNHQSHHMVCQISYLIYGLLFILCLGRDNDLCAFLSDLFQYLVQTLLKEVGSVGALRQLPFSAL